MKNKIIILVVVIVLMILLVPIPMYLRNGGTVEYKALTYKISKVHRLTGNLEKEYEDGTIIEILGIKVYDNVSETSNDETNSNTTTPYIPDGTNIADGNNTGTPTDTLEFNRNPQNVTIEVLKDTITKEKVEILITDNNEDQYGWGVQFKVQEKVNEEWKDLEYISDELSWIDIAYELNKDNQLTQKLDIEKYYGKLNNGTYRIVKSVYDSQYIDIYSNEFEIK